MANATKSTPLHETYLHFYAALSEEAAARQMHNMSIVKIQTLQSAKVSFEQARFSLPIPYIRNEDEDSNSNSTASDDEDDLASLNDSASSLDISSYQCDIPHPATPNDEEQSGSDEAALKPLPLQIRKTFDAGQGSFSSRRSFFEAMARNNSSPIPAKPNNMALKKESHQGSSSSKPILHHLTVSRGLSQHPVRKPFNPSTVRFADCATSWTQQRALERYNEHVLEFFHMLKKHLQTIDELIQRTEEAQRLRQTDERVAFCGDDEEAKQADLRARILRLKQGGWRRERFQPEKYEQLAEMALAEL